MRDIAITLLVFGALPFVLRRPWIGMLMYAWLSLMVPHRFAFGFAYNFPFVQVVAIVTLIGLLVSRDEVRYRPNIGLVLMILLPLWTCVTFLFSFEPASGLRRLEEVLKVFLFVHVCASVIRTREQIEWMVWVIVLSIGFFGVKGGLFTIASGASGRVYGPPGDSYLSDNNAISVALIMVIPLMYFLRSVSASKWIRYALLGAMLLSGMAVLGSYSRGAFLSIAAMIVFLWSKSSHKTVSAIMLAAAVPVAVTFMPDRWSDRMNTISTYETDSSATGRINTWMTAFNIANDRPLVGAGFEYYTPEAFARYAPDPQAVHSAHSVYFQMLGEHGYVGLLLFLGIFISAWWAARRVIAASATNPEHHWAGQLARAIQVSMVGFAVGGAFVNIGYWDLPYYEVALLFAARSLVLTASGATPARTDRQKQPQRVGV